MEILRAIGDFNESRINRECSRVSSPGWRDGGNNSLRCTWPEGEARRGNSDSSRGIGEGNGPVSREDGTRLDSQSSASGNVAKSVLLRGLACVLNGERLASVTGGLDQSHFHILKNAPTQVEHVLCH